MQRIRLLGIDGESTYKPCRLHISPWKDKVTLEINFNDPKKIKSIYKPYSLSGYYQTSCVLKKDSPIIKNPYIIHEMMKYSLQYVRNTYDRDNIIYDFLKEHCESKVLNVGESEMLLVGKVILSKGAYVNDADEDLLYQDPATLNLRVKQTGVDKKKVFYEQKFGPIVLPDDWDVQPSGNSAITRAIKKRGPVWTIYKFKNLHITNKIVPQVIGYAAPFDNIVEAKKYYIENKKRLQKEKVYRKIDKTNTIFGEEISNDDKKFLKSFFKSIQDKT